MATNDKDNIITGAHGVDTYPGVANPTVSSTHSDPYAANFVTDPTTSVTGAGASANYDGGGRARRNFRETAGVVEGRPGIIESTNIDPLNENSNKDDGWANHRSTSNNTSSGSAASAAASTAGSAASAAVNFVSGAAKLAYGHAMGDETTKQVGAEAVWGKERP